MIGKEIATIVNEEKSAGNYEVDFNGSYLSNGVYFYSLTVNGKSLTKKMLLIK